MQDLYNDAIILLKHLIQIPSFSREEENTAVLLTEFFEKRGIQVRRLGNNVICQNKYFDDAKPCILLNSHHDTVKPNTKYTVNPFEPIENEGKLYGLGSNDAGGCLVSLIAVFLYFYPQQNLRYNILFVASAEEEISGFNGIEAVVPSLPPIDFAIVGEPTLMQMAVAERGLMVLDGVAHGVAGHAARNEGENAILRAMKDIEWISNYSFDRTSPLLGSNKMSVTVIETENKAHNVVPASCNFVVDVRVNELYTFEEVLSIISANVSSDIKPRSTRLRSTSISLEHPLVKAGVQMGKTYYGSPTTSDKALMHFPSLKMGPGDSARSHTADEFIYVKEIEAGIKDYIEMLNKVLL
ncbi:MAG: M20 family metallo-hydrolase [Niabella sp.]